MRLWIGLLCVLLLSGCGYNEMQKNDESVGAAWGNVQSALQRRMDLVPNLVETVKGYAAHEKDTLQAVVDARAKATQMKLPVEALSDAHAMESYMKAQSDVSSALARLLAVVENYPDLKANQNFLDLQHQLEGTENRINVARERYNEAVQIYNTSIRTFPNSLTNSMLLHLAAKEYFKADEAAATAPKVKFN
ncbi:LemA family protein [Desulfolutivibrio sulfoxidireducens]|uniref:LemA family protein n=1 Tax=Desulfolutivibrio sulfoxidireducens TaxID=2773299 RepID=UPI00159D8852|nr:LemA family protein [Desulfolutivibrio sulfoxidireducens]QLA15818.1 LemA family protein [Desulfolutivibrio sulfoxidireducens]QLA20279.1 LemA family protein [Desulfolutivibrio sulfoxidireducens]